MSKILITSDIHFDSYPNRTPSAGYRLNQSYQVIENLLDIGRKEEIDYIFILGDILEKQNRDSDIHSVVKNCLTKLMTGFKAGYYILGNHDMKAKPVSSESTENDLLSSYLHLYTPSSLYYMDKKIIEIDGVSFGFRNYSASDVLDLSFIKESGRGYIDVLLGHSSQSYQDGEPPYPVQDYDESLVGLAFFGHIHQSVCKGSKISVGVPQRCKITDDKPKVIVYDTSVRAWKYVDADPAGKLMDFKETTSTQDDYFDPAENIYYISKKKPTENKELLKAVSSTGYEKIFDSEIKSRGLSEIHKSVKDSTPTENLERLDLDFQVTSIKVHNWRSIKDLSLNFLKSGKYLVSGHNGSGKSSLYSALSFGLSGKCPGQPKDNIRFGQKDMYVEVELSYHGGTYNIHRGTSKIEILKDGKILEFGNKTQTKEGILKELPFLEAMDLLYYNEGNQRILGQSSSSDTTKLQILYKILGLNEIDAYNSVAQGILKKLSKDFESIHESYLASEAVLSEKKSYLRTLELQYSGASPQDFNPATRIQELKNTLGKYQEMYQSKQEYDRKLSENSRISSEITVTNGIIEDILGRLEKSESKEDLIKKLDETRSSLSESKNKLEDLLNTQTEVSRLQARREFILQEGGRIKKELQDIEEEITKPFICKTYQVACPVVTEEMKRESLSSRKSELERLREEKLSEYYEINNALSLKEVSPIKIKELTEEVSNLNTSVSSLEREISDITSLENKLKEKQDYLKTLKPEDIPLPPDLPIDLLSRITNLTSEISTLEGYQRLKREYLETEKEHGKIKEEHDRVSKAISGYSEYIALTKPSGVVYTKIFEIIMESFSDNHVRYEVNVTKRGESRYINILSYLHKKGSEEVSYHGASQGEKCMMDIHFLSNLKVRFGLLILDEFLGNLDPDNHDEALRKMQSLETNLLLVTSHKENLITFPNHIEACIVNGDETKYNIG